jgi:quercetin dioxygenase-like cupin family protein
MPRRIRLIALLLSTTAAAVLTAAALSQTPPGTQPAIARKVLQSVEVPGSSYQVVEAKVEIAANSHIPKHTHPGAVVGYVLAGDYSLRLDGQVAKSVPPGESFVVPSGVVHEELTGAHAATILAVFTVEKGKPLTSPAP